MTDDEDGVEATQHWVRVVFWIYDWLGEGKSKVLLRIGVFLVMAILVWVFFSGFFYLRTPYSLITCMLMGLPSAVFTFALIFVPWSRFIDQNCLYEDRQCSICDRVFLAEGTLFCAGCSDFIQQPILCAQCGSRRRTKNLSPKCYACGAAYEWKRVCEKVQCDKRIIEMIENIFPNCWRDDR